MERTERKKKKLIWGFKSNFLAGIITILPLFITYLFFAWIMKFLYRKLDFIPQKLFPGNFLLTIAFEFVLLLIIIFGIYIFGIITSHYMGKQLLSLSERVLNRIPFIRTIYTGSKQIVNSFMANNKKKFMEVVLIEYPRKGIYGLGFVTGKIKLSEKRKSRELVLVFIPTTPNPTTGYLGIFKQSDVIKLKMTIDAAIKLIISGGIIGDKTLYKKV